MNPRSQWRAHVKTKLPPGAPCNVCGKATPLSDDHVPPRGTGNRTKVGMTPLIAVMSGVDAPVRESQNGMKYKTICARCNAHLGREYDPTLIAFRHGVARYVNASICVPTTVRWPVKVQRLMKGILGHLLAAEIDCPSPTLDSTVRNYVLDPCAPLPDGISLFFWLHRHQGSVVIPDMLMWSLRDHSLHRIHVLKFFPIGFLVTERTMYDGLPSLSRHRDAVLDEVVEIPVPIRALRPADWPEMPSDDNHTVPVIGQAAANAIFASPWNPKCSSDE